MRPTRMMVLATGLAVALGAGAAPSAASDVPDGSFVAGDTLRGEIDAPGDVDRAAFEGLRGMKLKLTVTNVANTKVAAPPIPKVEVLDGWNKSLGPRGKMRAGKPGIAVLGTSGDHTLRVMGVGTAVGGYQIVTQAILPRTAKTRTAKVRASKIFDGSATIDLLRGATLDVTVTPGRGVEGLGLGLFDPDGEEYDLGPWVQVDENGHLVVDDFLALKTGTWRLHLTGFPAAKKTATVKFVPTQPTGGAVRRLEECLLPPDVQPSLSTLTYSVAAGTTINLGAGTFGVTTLTGSSAFSGGSATVEGLLPDVTQIAFLSDESGQPFAPIVVRPADAGAAGVEIDVRRVALGVVGLHPWVARLDAARREQFFDVAPTAATFPFLETAVRQALAENPLALGDPAVYPEIFRAGDKAAQETLALLGWGAVKRAFHTPWGDFEEPATFSVFGSDTAHAVLVNPRDVFYGVEERGPGRRVRRHLVAPRSAMLHAFPAARPDPVAVGVDVLAGRTDFTADAIGPSSDLGTPEGLGTAANALCAVFYVVDLSTPLPLSPPELAELVTERYASAPLTAAEQEFFDELAALPWDSTPATLVGEIRNFLVRNAARNWRRVANDLWRWAPENLSAAYLIGPTRFLQGYFTVADMNASMPFLSEVYRVADEPALASCVTRKGNVVTPGCPPPFTFAPDFTSAPTVPSVGDQVNFDATATTFSDEPPAAPTYLWTIWDVPGAAPTVIDAGMSQGPVPFTFTTAGFHLVKLEVTVEGVTAGVFHSVQVESIPNLGFELGTMDFWTVETHSWWNTTPGSEASHSAIVTQGFDPIATALPMVFHGAYSLRIEDSSWGGYISSASRTLRVPTGGMVFKFAWAAVLEDPQHQPWEQPYFDIRVTDQTTAEELYAIHHYSGEPGYPWNNADAWGSWKWVPWQPVTLDLTGRDGHDIVISAIAADCEPTGHGGYVYFDAP